MDHLVVVTGWLWGIWARGREGSKDVKLSLCAQQQKQHTILRVMKLNGRKSTHICTHRVGVSECNATWVQPVRDIAGWWEVAGGWTLVHVCWLWGATGALWGSRNISGCWGWRGATGGLEVAWVKQSGDRCDGKTWGGMWLIPCVLHLSCWWRCACRCRGYCGWSVDLKRTRVVTQQGGDQPEENWVMMWWWLKKS